MRNLQNMFFSDIFVGCNIYSSVLKFFVITYIQDMGQIKLFLVFHWSFCYITKKIVNL